jgi:hypothetical protein
MQVDHDDEHVELRRNMASYGEARRAAEKHGELPRSNDVSDMFAGAPQVPGGWRQLLAAGEEEHGWVRHLAEAAACT